MKRVAVLVTRGRTTPGTILGPAQLFPTVNAFLVEAGLSPAFEVQLVGLTGDSEVYDGFVTVTPQVGLDHASEADLIIVPATHGEVGRVVADNAAFLPWIRDQHRHGAEVASLCVGAFLLAATGLLDGCRVTTHWISAPAFRKAYPGLNLVSGAILTDEHGLYTSGGALSFWNLLLYLVEKSVGREWAVRAAKFFEVEIDRHNQAGFLIFQGQKDHGDPVILAVQEYLEAHFQDRITVTSLCDRFALGRRSLERRFRAATSDSVSDYLQRVRIEAAKKAFETGNPTVAEVMDQVGYGDTKAFRSTFRRVAGVTPQEYRTRYQRLAGTGSRLDGPAVGLRG